MTGLRFALAGTLGRGVLQALLGTVRFRLEYETAYDPFEHQPVIFSLWHGRLLPLTYFHRHRGITAIISRSEDGEYISRVVEGWGYETVRGSTSRGGGEALRGLVKAIRQGHSLAITPDGPRGPRQQLQDGVLRVAQLSARPIIPTTCACTRAWWPGSWDRFCVPKPFSTVTIRYGAPYHVERDASPAALEAHRVELETRMNRMTRELDGDGGPAR